MKIRLAVSLIALVFCSVQVMAQEVSPSELQKQKPDNYQVRLFDAVKNNNLVQVTTLINTHPELVKSLDEDGANALFPAIVAGNVEISEFLIAHGADINCVAKVDGLTPLHIAVAFRGGNIELTKILLKHGANPNPIARVVVGNMGSTNKAEFQKLTPLMLAVIASDNPVIVNELLHYGADPYLKNFEDAGTALDFALICNQMDDENSEEYTPRTNVIKLLREWMNAHPKK